MKTIGGYGSQNQRLLKRKRLVKFVMFLCLAVFSISFYQNAFNDTRALDKVPQLDYKEVRFDPEKPLEVATEPNDVVPKVESIKDTIYRVAGEEGVNPKILYAISLVECPSQDPIKCVGDKGFSYGIFQIFLKVHPDISVAQAQDIEFSARWSAKRLKHYSFMGLWEMIRSHNGLVKNHSNDGYVNKVLEIVKSL
jgi:hypothetical protein